MFRAIADFTNEWEHERGMTQKVIGHLTEASLAQAVRPGGRMIGCLAWPPRLSEFFYALAKLRKLR